MAHLIKLAQAFEAFPLLQESFNTNEILLFVDLCCHLRPELELNPSNDCSLPPLHLPENVRSFLALAIFYSKKSVAIEAVNYAWKALSRIIWNASERSAPHTAFHLFLKYGLELGISWRTIGPPTTTCVYAECSKHGFPLTNRKTYPATLFTRNEGPIPIFPSHLYCEVGLALVPTTITPNSRGFQMDMEHVWNTFFLHALLLDSIRSRTRLSLPNNKIQHTDRYTAALCIRNEIYKAAGRLFWNHVCDLCSKIVVRNGVPVLIRAAVVDGVTIGHPCCAIHDCMELLPSRNVHNSKPRYCNTHQALESKCATIDCNNLAVNPFKSCAVVDCRRLEESYKASGTSMFQLKARLARNQERLTGKDTLAPFQGSAAAEIGLVLDEDNAMEVLADDKAVQVEIEVDGNCDGKSGDRRRKIKGRFGRNRTHNDESCVYSCGMIAGRAAMYGSEAPNGVRIFLHNLFPTPESLPSYIFHDNNCQVRKMLDRSFPGDRLHQIAMPIDVFHFSCKHKEGDKYCATHCNPASFPELIEDGKWVFNSSAAEQANAWIGGFLAIVHEMRAERYNFFLDEMVRRRDEWLFKELERKGQHPRYLDYNILLGSLSQ